MSLTLGIAIYIVIWWMVLFAVLPIGVRTQGEDGAVVPGTPGERADAPRLLRVVLLTTARDRRCAVRGAVGCALRLTRAGWTSAVR